MTTGLTILGAYTLTCVIVKIILALDAPENRRERA